MSNQDPNNKCRELEGVSFSSQDHARRPSVITAAEKSPATARNQHQAQQKQQVTGPQAQDAGQTCGTHSMGYSPTQAPTPLPEPESILGSPMNFELDVPGSPDPSDDQIFLDVVGFIHEEMDTSGLHHASWCFQHADHSPPITPSSLAELDMPRIINNPKLRHDVNFDRELHFRPNLDGSKGRQKMLQADQYWKALEAELVMLSVVRLRKVSSKDEAYWDRILKASLVRLPKIFAAIRDILKTLVPDYDQTVVSDRLDVEHIMQQIENGVCDLNDLGNWLAKVLKNHCAPMRDPLVDAMQKEIRRGARDNRPEKLVSGLRQLMNILEAMKLDVANHQIRHMRALLIEDTINFQRRYNAHRILIGKINGPESKEWLQYSLEGQDSHMDALTSGLIRDMLENDSANMCPATFYLDTDRLRALRIELHSRVYHEICREVLQETIPRGVAAANVARASLTLQSSISDIVGSQGRFTERIDNIAVEIVRVAMEAHGQASGFDMDLLNAVEDRLRSCLRPSSEAFVRHAEVLERHLIPKVQRRVQDHVRYTALDLQDTLVPQAAPSNRNSMGFGAVLEPVIGAQALSADFDEDIIRRFTHILALHWQVWSELVYLVEDQCKSDDDSSSEHGSDSTAVQSARGSPTMPIAQAVYAPGRKWLPVSVTVTDVPSGLPSGLPTPSPTPEPAQQMAENEAEKQGSEEATETSQEPETSQEQRA